MLVGTAVRPEQLSEQAYAATLAREYNMVEPEDAMKWWVLRPDSAGFDFRPADRVVDFAHAHGMEVRGHTLVWGRSNPQWLNDRHWEPMELSRLCKNILPAWSGTFVARSSHGMWSTKRSMNTAG